MTGPSDTFHIEERNLIFDDYRIMLSEEQREALVSILRKEGFLKENESFDDYYRYVTRLLHNPTVEVRNIIREERSKLGSASKQIGVHVRCGGNLADTHENTAMVTEGILSSVPSMIRQTIVESGVNGSYVYLATDSSYAYRNLTASLYPIEVKATSLYKRGHTDQGSVTKLVIRRSILELFLIVQSQSLLLSSASSYSRLIRWMSHAKVLNFINAPYSFLK